MCGTQINVKCVDFSALDQVVLVTLSAKTATLNKYEMLPVLLER